MLRKEAATVLESASTVLCLPDWWTQHHPAKGPNLFGAMRELQATDMRACMFCATGAIEAAIDLYYKRRPREIREEIANVATAYVHDLIAVRAPVGKRPRGVEPWNDSPRRNNFEVAEALWTAAQELRA